MEIHFTGGQPEPAPLVLLLPDDDYTACCTSAYDDWCPYSNVVHIAEAARSWAADHDVTGDVLTLHEAAERGTARWRPLTTSQPANGRQRAQQNSPGSHSFCRAHGAACSFCRKRRADGLRLVAGPGVSSAPSASRRTTRSSLARNPADRRLASAFRVGSVRGATGLGPRLWVGCPARVCSPAGAGCRWRAALL